MSDETPEVILGGIRPSKPGRDLDARFWEVEPSGDPDKPAQVHGKVHPWAVRLKACWRNCAQLDREHDIIYENRALKRGGRWHSAVKALEAVRDFDASRLFVTTSIVDTFQARMVKRHTMPMIVVDDAEWELKTKAEDFRGWLHGKLRSDACERNRAMIIRDAIVRGDGVEYIDDGDDDVIIERSHRDEWLADPYEAEHGLDALRTLYRFRTVSRDAVIARFPQFKSQIEDVAPAPARADDSYHRDWLASPSELGARDVVDLVEAWHLPSGCDAKDGRKVVCVDGFTLCYEEWTEPRFPRATYTWHDPMSGILGYGDVERLRGIQREINQICRDIAMNIEVGGKVIVLAPPGIEPAQTVGFRPFMITIPAGASSRVEHVIPPPCSPAQIDYLERKITKAHDLTGAAQWFAQGRAPLGAGASGVAIDTMEDSLSDRHAVREHNTSRYTVARSQALIDAARRTSKRIKDGVGRDGQKRRRMVQVTWMDKGTLRRLDFDDASLEADKYEIGIEPISQIPTTRAGKFAWVSEMIAKGVIPSSQAPALYDEPDVAHANRILLAKLKNCEKMMGMLGDPEKYPEPPTPDEWHDLPLLLEYARAYYNRAQAERCPVDAPPEAQDRADLVETRYREFGDAVVALQAKAKAPPPSDPLALAAGGAPVPPDPMQPAPPPMAGIDPMAGAAPPMMPPVG